MRARGSRVARTRGGRRFSTDPRDALPAPDIGFAFFLKGFAAAVLGGLTSLPGAVLGGLIVGIAESLAGGYIHSSVMELSPFLVIMVVLVLRPTGLLGARAARRV